MSRTLSASLISHLATRTHTRCSMLRLDLADGTAIGITDHDRDLDFDLGDGSISYSASTGMMPSDLTLSAGFDADNFEVSGPIGDTVSLAAVLGGRFNQAQARLFQVNWASLGSGAIKLMLGHVGDAARVEGGRFVLPIQSEVARFNEVIGELMTPYCKADYGDARCGLTVTPVAAEVTAVTDAMRFTVSFAGAYADDYFNLGTALFTSGDLDGTRPVEIFDWTSGGALTLFVPLAAAPEVGDLLELRQGCAKTRAACMAFFNMENFRGEPDMPGSDQVLKYAQPGN